MITSLVIITIFKNNSFNANSVEPDQTPGSAASDLGLQLFASYHLRVSKLTWINKKI